MKAKNMKTNRPDRWTRGVDLTPELQEMYLAEFRCRCYSHENLRRGDVPDETLLSEHAFRADIPAMPVYFDTGDEVDVRRPDDMNPDDDAHLTDDERLADRLTERPAFRAARLAAKKIDPETARTWRRALGMET